MAEDLDKTTAPLWNNFNLPQPPLITIVSKHSQFGK